MGAPVRPPLEEIRDGKHPSRYFASVVDWAFHLEAEREWDAERIAALEESRDYWRRMIARCEESMARMEAENARLLVMNARLNGR